MPCPECPETPDTGCLQPITTECVTYDGNDIDCADISSGQSLNQVIEQLANNDCGLQEQIEDIVQDVEELSGSVINLQINLEELSGNIQTQINNIPVFSCEDLSGCSLDDLSDVDISPASGDSLIYNGVKWINYTPETIDTFSCSDLSGCTLDSLGNVVETSSTSGDILVRNNSNWVNQSFASLYTANNGLTKTLNNIKLGGILNQNTTINTSNFTFDFAEPNQTNLGLNSFALYCSKNITTGGTETIKTLKAGIASSLNIELTSNLTPLSGTGTGNKHGVFSGTVYKNSNFNWNGILPVYFAEQEHSGAGNTNWAVAYKANPPTQMGGFPTFTGSIINAVGLYIEDINSSNIANKITNKIAIFQEGTSDKNVFYGEIEYHGALTNASDIRSKNKGENFTKGLSVIEQINPVNFTKKEGFGATDVNHVGIIAQEIENIIPEAIKIGKCKDIEDFRFYDQSVLIYTLINAIKELSIKVKQLENAIK